MHFLLKTDYQKSTISMLDHCFGSQIAIWF